MADLKFKRIATIKNDAPTEGPQFYTISFLSPDKLEETKLLDVKGIFIHNGYMTEDQAHSDAKEIRRKFVNHDVYVCEVGKLYAWDDATRSEKFDYQDKDLNQMEQKRREEIDKLKIVGEQYRNEKLAPIQKSDHVKRATNAKERLREKLYKSGKISKQEYERISEKIRVKNLNSEDEEKKKSLLEKVELESAVDYLNESEPALKIACVSIYSPNFIKGLSVLCFKVRGMFELDSQFKSRQSHLSSTCPDDPIYRITMGRWCPYSDVPNLDPEFALRQLNYAMKAHLDSMETQNREFKERKDTMKKAAEREGSKTNRLREDDDVRTRTKSTDNEEKLPIVTNPQDRANLDELVAFLDDEELRNKHSVKDKSQLQTTSLNLN